MASKSKIQHSARMVFECAFCKAKYHIGHNYTDTSEMYHEVDKLLRAGCNKCGGRIIFKEHSYT